MFRFHFKLSLVLLMIATIAVAQTGVAPAVDDTTLADQYFAKAEKFVKDARFDSSIFYYEKAGRLYEKTATQLQQPRLWEKYIKSYNQLGNSYRRKKELEKALACLNQALTTGRKQLGENHLEVAQSWHNLGSVYVEQPNFEKALEYFNRALSLRIHALGENHLEVAKSYNNIGVVYNNKSDFEKALIYFNKSLAIKYKVLGENTLDVARTYSNLGDLYLLQGNFDLALEFMKKTLAIKLKLFDANHPEVGSTYLNLGNVYLEQLKFDLTLENYKKALEISLQTYGENSFNVAGICDNIGFVLQLQGDYEQAMTYFNRALSIYKINDHENLDFARNYYNTGELYLRKNELSAALDYYGKALAIRREALGQHDPTVARTYWRIAQIYCQQNNFAKGIASAHLAILSVTPAFTDTNVYANPPLQNIRSEVELLPALHMKALNFERLFSLQSHSPQDLQTSLSTYQLASDLIDKTRRSYRTEGSQLYLGDRASEVYENAIRVALVAHHTAKDPKFKEQAFSFAEKRQAAALAQALQESQTKHFAGLPPDLLEKEKNLKIDLAFYETELEKEKQKAEKADKVRLRQHEDRYFTLAREYEKLLGRFEKNHPQYYALKYRTSAASVAELQKTLDDKTALVEYFWGDKTIFAFAVAKDAFEAISIDRDSSFDAVVTSLSNSFKKVTSKIAYQQSAAQLYRTLVQPLASRFTNKPHWIIIPDGKLHQIPFEALLTENVVTQADADYRTLPYLIKQHEISYHYSATLFLKSLTENRAGSSANLFAGFAPVFDGTVKNNVIYRNSPEDSSAVSVVAKTDSTFLATRDGKTLDPLPHSAQEVQTILTSFPGRSRAFLQQEASEENFKQQIKGYKYVHLATHGRMVETNPKLSNLAFSQPQDNTVKEDGILYSAETYNLDLNADLLVLSACQTGAGQIVKGEGLMGLTRGFLYSGARNIIASLWKVYDQHTSLLMIEMYRQITVGKSYSAALREAKLKMIANPKTAAP
ncbi:MAG: CHAT domain-containing protein, partial [bacterium]